MTLSDWLGVGGIAVALVAFGIAARWNHLNEKSLVGLRDAIEVLRARNDDIASSVSSLQATVAQLDSIRKLLGRAAMASSPESFILLALAERTQGVMFGELCDLAQSRRYGQPEMRDAAHFLRDQGFIRFQRPLSPTTVIEEGPAAGVRATDAAP